MSKNLLIGETSSRLNVEVVKHEERRKVAQVGSTNGATHASALALGLLNGKKDLADGSLDRHL